MHRHGSMAVLDRVVRRERGRLIADLVRQLGNRNFALAEDVAQEALIRAMSTWPYRGMPDNPSAWLARVARNLALDHLRRQRHEAGEPKRASITRDSGSAVFEAQVNDPELRLILLCCHNELSELERLTLTLRLACGFTTREIAGVFLAGGSAIGQRIARAKRTLRLLGNDLDALPMRAGIRSRLPTALKVIYLMFSLGYSPLSGERSVRLDVAREAIRLAGELAANEITGTAESQALAALLCFQGSRLPARETADGEVLRLCEQDRGHWDRALVERGFRYLVASRSAKRLSRYHIEAGIAATHAAAIDTGICDWGSIVAQYAQLERMLRSPVVAINASVAIAMAGDPDTGLKKLDSLRDIESLKHYAPYFIARAEIMRLLDRNDDATDCYARAMDCRASAPVIRHLEKRLASCL